ncbi:hypothetical protein FACS189463_2780 [Bacteroidia bacterium]|nr:hypothetical protein FACS189463_2780 [Bacteroidia bacterium]
MKKMNFLVLSLIVLSVTSVKAQVKIGADSDPHAGAILDLTSANDKGLLLPNVALQDEEILQVDGLARKGADASARGMVVYNTNAYALDGKGIYVWDGDKWIGIKAQGKESCVPEPPTGISFSKTSNIKLNEEITATATPEVTIGGTVPTQYNWTIPAAYFDIVNGTNARVITLKAKATALLITTAIQVNAQNTCGTSADYTNTTAINILNCSTVPAQPGAITISPTTVSAGENFTASIGSVSGAMGYTWNVPSGLTVVSGQNTVSITYKTSSQGTIAAGDITVYASNDCGNGTARASSNAVTINAAGYTIANGVYNGPALSTAIQEGATLAQLVNSYGFSATGGSLLLDGSNLSDRATWYNAQTECAAKGDGWRLPNLAELANLQDNYVSYGMPHGFYYWSITDHDNANAWLWGFNNGGDTFYNAKSGKAYVRCVKSL